MCGIAGIIAYRPDAHRDSLEHDIRAITASMAHRGNTPAQFYTDPHHVCHLGHQRLAILDLSDGGKQPFVSPDGRYVIVHNGQVYNYRELAKELHEDYGVTCQSSCDTEVVLYSYLIWKEKCLSKFNGQFAFAVWDSRDKTLFIVRDRLGIKPLYWYYGPAYNGQVVFAWSSELTALLSSSFISRCTTKDLLAHYLMYYSMHPPCTIIDGVYALRPGHYLTLNDTGYDIKSYYHLNAQHADIHPPSRSEAVSTIRTKLINAVSLRLRSDVPVGALLSGGIDSTVVVAIASRILGQQVPVFSLGFNGPGSELSEVPVARDIARELGCEQQVYYADAAAFEALFSSFIDHLDQPSGDGLNTFLISSLATQHVSVILSGLGGDELFLGYRYFRDMIRVDTVTRHSLLRRFLPAVARGAQKYRVLRSLAYRARMQPLLSWPFQHEELYTRGRMIFTPYNVMKLLGLSSMPSDHSGELASIFEQESDTLNAFSKAELQWYIPGMLLRDADSMAMAWTLEARFPFLDTDVVSYLLSLPSTYKVENMTRQNKSLLVEAFRDIVPKTCLTAPKKGFEMPVGFWLAAVGNHEIDKLREVLWLNASEVQQIVTKFYADPREYLPVWTLFMVSRWLEKWGVTVYEKEKEDTVHSPRQRYWRGTAQSSVSH